MSVKVRDGGEAIHQQRPGGQEPETMSNYTDLFGHLAEKKVLFARGRTAVYNAIYRGMIARRAARENIVETDQVEAELGRRRRSDTVFIFGSGRSILDVRPAEWAKIAKVDTISFNWFAYQSFVRIDHHLVRETYGPAKKWRDLERVCRHYTDVLNANRHYADSLLHFQGDAGATSANCIRAFEMCSHQRAVFTTASRSEYSEPSTSYARGLVHGPGTLTDAINLAIIGGWREIVLAGVDLYDRQYFWLPADSHNAGREPELGAMATHSTAVNGVVDFLTRWRDWLAHRGRSLSVLNPRSLAAGPLAVYSV